MGRNSGSGANEGVYLGTPNGVAAFGLLPIEMSEFNRFRHPPEEMRYQRPGSLRLLRSLP